MDIGGCTWAFPDSGGSSDTARTLDGEWHDAQVVIVDQVFGAGTVGAFACNDGDGDGLCGETSQGEVAAGFCGTSPILSSDRDWDGGGHADLGASFSVLVDGPLGQALSGCGPAASPAGGLTGDILVGFLGGFGPEGQAV